MKHLLGNSCFLTLSRKHNKNKTWVYAVYSYDLSLFGTEYSFPTSFVITKLKRKFILNSVNHLFNDYLFLVHE